MLQIDTLQSVSTEEIRLCFNEAFHKYFVPVNLNAAQFEQKLTIEGYAPSISAGTFAGDKLVGFILHSEGLHGNKRTAYNSGTGVVPSHRGQQLLRRMYDYLLPLLKEKKVQKSILEVIQENEKAQRAYKDAGFTIVRELYSYQGTVEEPAAYSAVEELQIEDWSRAEALWSWEPSWQHSQQCLQRAIGSYKTYGIKKEGALVAYAVINPLTNRIPSFAVASKWRNKGLGSTLFQHLQYHFPAKPLTVINVDSQSAETLSFLEKQGLSPLVKQFEMELLIS